MAHVLWLSTELPDRYGQGGQRRQFHQIRALMRRGHTVTVLVPMSGQNQVSIAAVTDLIRPRTALLGRSIPWAFRRLRRTILSRDWDAIVVSHVESFWLLPNDRLPEIPILTDVHNVMSRWHAISDRPEEAAEALRDEHLVLSRSSIVTTCSEEERRRLVAAHPSFGEKVVAAPLGVDPDEWPAVDFPRDEPLVALFGSWGWHPNQRGLGWFMDQVWPSVTARMPDALAHIAGGGIPAPDRLPEGMVAVGRVPDLARFTAAATVVAVPVLDGVGAAVKFAESLASGASVIATPDGANAFDDTPAFVSADPKVWAEWILERLRSRKDEPAPAAGREFALGRLTWDEAVRPIDDWLRSATHSARVPN